MKKAFIRRFRHCIRQLERELEIQNNVCCSPKVSMVQCHALLEIDSNESINLNELSEKLNLDKSTVSRTVNGLVKNRMVHRNVPDDNRRTINISLTGKGNEVCSQINRDNDEYFENLLGTIPEEDLTVFLRSFELFTLGMAELNTSLNNHCQT